MTQFANQANIRLISQLIRDILRVLQELLTYFNGTAISTSTVHPSLVLFVNLDLNLNGFESAMLSFGSFLQYCHKLHDVFE